MSKKVETSLDHCANYVYSRYMLLKRLFTSQTRVKLLTLFMLNHEEEFFIRELTRRLEEQINSIRRELDNMKRAGILKSRMKNRKKFYVVNKECPIFPELRSIITKTTDQNARVVQGILKLGTVELIVLSGIFLHKESDVDLLVVGEIDKGKLTSFLEKEVSSEEPTRFSLMNKADFLYRIKCNDRFVKQLVTDTQNLIAHNELQME